MILEARFEVAVGAFVLRAELVLEQGVLVLFGPSGAGKSVAIRTLAGLHRPRRGTIRLGDRVLVDDRTFVPPHRRRIGYVPQHHALFPFRDVYANVAFGLPRHARRRGNPRVLALLDELGIRALERAPADTLSGGERQKVALARALVVEPRLLLLDEPFASIDRDARRALRTLLRELLDRHDVPAVFVTHSPQEAAQVGDRVAVFERGRTVGHVAPEEVGPPAVRLVGRRRSHRVEGDRLAVELDQATVTGPPSLLDRDEIRLSLHPGLPED